jgi:hypothetical protein
MPGPQLRSAVPVCRAFREKYPRVPIVWGGYFPSLYSEAALNAGYVDFVVKGQGEDTLLELIGALGGARDFARIRGLAFKDQFGLHVHTAERLLKAPDEFPWPPYHRLDASRYIARTFLGSRTAVHQASIGCPFRCNFCGVVPVYDREKMESPDRTTAILTHLQAAYGINAVQFYDNNFFLREDHARELAGRIAPLGLRWWCEARIDIVNSYSDDTLRRLRQAGCVMIFFGVESGSDATLRSMKKQLTAAESVALAQRIREFDIIPEYSLIFGNPEDPDRDLAELDEEVDERHQGAVARECHPEAVRRVHDDLGIGAGQRPTGRELQEAGRVERPAPADLQHLLEARVEEADAESDPQDRGRLSGRAVHDGLLRGSLGRPFRGLVAVPFRSGSMLGEAGPWYRQPSVMRKRAVFPVDRWAVQRQAQVPPHAVRRGSGPGIWAIGPGTGA